MKRWLESTAATIALTVVVAMVLGLSLQNLVGSGLTYLGLARRTGAFNADTRLFSMMPGRVATLIDELNSAPTANRASTIETSQRPHFRARLNDRPMQHLVDRDDPDANVLRQRIQTSLAVHKPIKIGYRFPPDAPGGNQNWHGTIIETTLVDGTWVLFVSDLNIPPAIDPIAANFSRTSFAAWLLISALSGSLLSLLAARRLVRPLAQLAAGAEQLGGSGEAPAIRAWGPSEVRAAIEAFNRMQERLRRFNDDRTRMIAAMSHDLRTPLTRLRLRLEVIENPDQQQKLLAELDRMTGLVESILAFARDDSKQEQRTLMDLSALVEGICEDAVDAGESVTFSGPRKITASCRPTALRRALTNIVDNAVKYGENAAVKLETEPDRVIITVEDDGPGVPRSERERVFEPFFKLDSSRNADAGGVGLGLSVARSIVWEHGGNIALTDSSTGGLNVRLELPVGLMQSLV